MPLTTDSLVYTKLRPSQARPKLVACPRLTARLEREAARKLTLISAPAGFGKTTLLVEWLRQRADGEGSVAWMSLDDGDNDPVRFLSYLIAALRTIEERIGEGILSSLRSPEPPSIEALAGALINEMAGIPNELFIVFDDYHLIDAEPVHGIVSFLLDNLPPNVQLIIASRVDPPLQLSRLRARGQMTELRVADLRFTQEEAAAFLRDVMALDLSTENAAALEERTEGWVAGLQLAALSTRGREDVSGFVEAFSGSHRDFLDFLAEEVLERQPEDERSFLLETSFLKHLTAALCEVLTGRDDGQEMLERLERENLFVVPLDDERRWYRYHHLFRDFLRTRLERENPKRVEELHRAAATWCERHGLVDEAVRHALAAGEPGRAARLIERHVTGIFAHNERATVERWLATLPAEVVRSRPRLCLARAYRAMVGGRLDELERLLDDAERAQAAADSGPGEQEAAPPAETGWAAAFLADVPGTVAVLRAALARLRGDAARTVEFARLARARVTEGHFVGVLADWELARARWMYGDLAEAERALRGQLDEAVAARRAAEQPYRALVVSWDLGRVQSAQGRLRSALRTYRDALKLATEAGRSATSVAGIAHVGLAEVLREQNELDAALEHADEGVERCRSLANRMPLAAGLATLARIRQALGNPAGALEAIGEAERAGLSPEITDLFNPVPVQRVRLMLAQGEVAEAARWTAASAALASRTSRATSGSASTSSWRACCSPNTSPSRREDCSDRCWRPRKRRIVRAAS